MNFNIFKEKGKGQLSITSLNLRWHGQMHAMEGLVPKERRFTVTIPFQNKTAQDKLPFEALKQRFKAEEQPPIVISGIQLSDPFKLVSVEPKLPRSVASGERVEFVVTVDGPDYGYNGPLTVMLNSEEASMIKVQINKVMLRTASKSVEIENSGVILNMPKGGIFKNSVQLYKALSYGDVVTRVTIGKPFDFVESEPHLPFTVNDPSSYLVTFYVRAPDLDYAGPMEIKLE